MKPYSLPLARVATLVAALAAMTLAAVPGLAAAAKPAARDVERGRALAASVRDERPAEPTFSRGTLRIRHGDGRRLVIPVEVQVVLGTNDWSTLYKATFPDGRREVLTVVKPSASPPWFILHRTGRDGKASEVRPERPEEVFASFAGTDFWFADLGMVFLHWPDQRWLGRDTRRTRTCNMLESRNPQPSPGAYSRVVTWIDEETGGIVRAEAFDAKNKLFKEFSPGSFARVGSRYELRDMEIRTNPLDSKTTLEFQIDDPEKLGVKHLPTKN